MDWHEIILTDAQVGRARRERDGEDGAPRPVEHEDGSPVQPRDARGDAGGRTEARTEGERGAGI
jgi:hypothetical protein